MSVCKSYASGQSCLPAYHPDLPDLANEPEKEDIEMNIVSVLLVAALLNFCFLPVSVETHDEPLRILSAYPLPDSHQTQTRQTLSRANLDERLRTVTELAKERCGISDRYTDFSGDQSVEGGEIRWYLRWWDESGTASVSCDDEGYPYQFSCHENELWEYEPYFAPRVPNNTKSLRDAVQAFLKNALRENEDCQIEFPEKRLNLNPGESVYLRGALLRDGLRTDIRCTLEIDPKTMAVRSFWRSDDWLRLTGTDRPEAVVIDEKQADEQLKDVVRLTLQYVPDGENRAELRYVPEDAGRWTLLAVSGEMYDLNVGRGGEWNAMDAPAQADMVSEEKGLTQAEIAGAEKLKNALPEEKLDAAARCMTELGVTEDYALQSVRYSTEGECVMARLTYRAEVRDVAECQRLLGAAEGTAEEVFHRLEDGKLSRNVTLDAHTGALLEMDSYGGYYSTAYEFDNYAADTAQKRAFHFLEKYLPEHTANMIIRPAVFPAEDGYYNPRVQVRGVRCENGVPYPANAAYLSVNIATGYIDSYTLTWTDEDIAFEPTEGIIDEIAAYAAYCEAMNAVLRWRTLPAVQNRSETKYYLALCYDLVSEPQVTAVRARDGSLVTMETTPMRYEYDDVTDHAANELAGYGVGIPGDQFLPDRKITNREAASLLVSLGNPSAWDLDDETLLMCAREYRLALTKKELDEDITREELVRSILSMAGYHRAAALTDAFCSSFADAETFGGDLGFIALAEAMGMVEVCAPGDVFRPRDAATRGEAAEMLWRFLNRP